MPQGLKSLFIALLRVNAAINQYVWRLRLGAFGRGSFIHRGARIMVPSQLRIGERVALNSFVHIWAGGGVNIGDDSIVAAGTVITSQTHDLYAAQRSVSYRDTNEFAPVTIGRNVWIGSNVVVLPGIQIGDGAVVGAGSVVTKDVEPFTLVVGVPAAFARSLPRL